MEFKKQAEYDEIIVSRLNGQRKQAVRQIDEFGIDDFLDYLDHDEIHSTTIKYIMLRTYIRVKNEH